MNMNIYKARQALSASIENQFETFRAENNIEGMQERIDCARELQLNDLADYLTILVPVTFSDYSNSEPEYV